MWYQSMLSNLQVYALDPVIIFIIINTTTKWLQIFPAKKITSEKTISNKEELFMFFGVPKIMVSDNVAYDHVTCFYNLALSN